jgi:hypothetical protein
MTCPAPTACTWRRCARPIRLTIDEADRDLLALQVFLVNDRTPLAGRSDEAYAFQAAIELRCEEGFVPRPDLRSAGARDWDQQVNDLHFAQVGELAVGHNVAAEWDDASPCSRVRTAWMPQAVVPGSSRTRRSRASEAWRC